MCLAFWLQLYMLSCKRSPLKYTLDLWTIVMFRGPVVHKPQCAIPNCIALVMYLRYAIIYWPCPVTHQRCWAQSWWQSLNPEQPVFASAGALFSHRWSQATSLNILPCPGASSAPRRYTEHRTLHCWETSNRVRHTWSPLRPDMPQARRKPCLSKCALKKVSDTTWRVRIHLPWGNANPV